MHVSYLDCSNLVEMFVIQLPNEWNFVQKHEILTHAEISLLLWLHNKKVAFEAKAKRFGNINFLFECWKICHSFTVHIHEIFLTLSEKFCLAGQPYFILYLFYYADMPTANQTFIKCCNCCIAVVMGRRQSHIIDKFWQNSHNMPRGCLVA